MAIFLNSFLTLFLIRLNRLAFKMSRRTCVRLKIWRISSWLGHRSQNMMASRIASVSSLDHSTLPDSMDDGGFSGIETTNAAVLSLGLSSGSSYGSTVGRLSEVPQAVEYNLDVRLGVDKRAQQRIGLHECHHAFRSWLNSALQVLSKYLFDLHTLRR